MESIRSKGRRWWQSYVTPKIKYSVGSLLKRVQSVLTMRSKVPFPWIHAWGGGVPSHSESRTGSSSSKQYGGGDRSWLLRLGQKNEPSSCLAGHSPSSEEALTGSQEEPPCWRNWGPQPPASFYPQIRVEKPSDVSSPQASSPHKRPQRSHPLPGILPHRMVVLNH